MLQHFRPHTYTLVYLLILSYAWAIVKAPVFEIFHSVAHTASVMNTQFRFDGSHEHSQEIMASELEELRNAQEESEQNKQHSITLEIKKQIKILNPLIEVNLTKYQYTSSNFPLLFMRSTIHRAINVPPPQRL